MSSHPSISLLLSFLGQPDIYRHLRVGSTMPTLNILSLIRIVHNWSVGLCAEYLSICFYPSRPDRRTPDSLFASGERRTA